MRGALGPESIIFQHIFIMELANCFGLIRGKYIGEPPLYVDKTRPPGMTELPKPTILGWIRNAPFVLINSPNFVWAVISLVTYAYAPYDLSINSSAALAPLSYRFISERLPIWFSLVFGYFSFWHIALYGFHLASRPFIADRPYNTDKVIHNAFWTSSGIVIWTAFENVFCYLWATGRLSYISNADSFTSLFGIYRFVAALMLVPLWRSMHFYFAHRFLHYKPLYQQVHSLHHRNTDIEPFSGLCMHPVEHLYYFACVMPSLFFLCSPYAFLWNGVHLLLSPAASHSGYEDHFQSDIFHYLHHRFFECNYAGSDAAFMDIAFGTFRGSLEDEPKPREDSKSSLRLVPTGEFVSYLLLSGACVSPWFFVKIESQTYAIILSSLAGFGPVLLATVMSSMYRGSAGVERVKMNFWGNFLHIVFGICFCSIPITYAAYLTISPPT